MRKIVAFCFLFVLAQSSSYARLTINSINSTPWYGSWLYYNNFQTVNEGSEAITFLDGFVNSDSKTDFVQIWDNNGSAGFITYVSNGNGFNRVWGNAFMGGSGAITWLKADYNGDGLMDILQPWNDNERLALEVYKSNGDGSYSIAWSPTWDGVNMGGSNAVAYLIGNVNNDNYSD
jgi:hypothetical protein